MEESLITGHKFKSRVDSKAILKSIVDNLSDKDIAAIIQGRVGFIEDIVEGKKTYKIREITNPEEQKKAREFYKLDVGNIEKAKLQIVEAIIATEKQGYQDEQRKMLGVAKTEDFTKKIHASAESGTEHGKRLSTKIKDEVTLGVEDLDDIVKVAKETIGEYEAGDAKRGTDAHKKASEILKLVKQSEKELKELGVKNYKQDTDDKIIKDVQEKIDTIKEDTKTQTPQQEMLRESIGTSKGDYDFKEITSVDDYNKVLEDISKLSSEDSGGLNEKAKAILEAKKKEKINISEEQKKLAEIEEELASNNATWSPSDESALKEKIGEIEKIKTYEGLPDEATLSADIKETSEELKKNEQVLKETEDIKISKEKHNNKKLENAKNELEGIEKLVEAKKLIEQELKNLEKVDESKLSSLQKQAKKEEAEIKELYNELDSEEGFEELIKRDEKLGKTKEKIEQIKNKQNLQNESEKIDSTIKKKNKENIEKNKSDAEEYLKKIENKKEASVKVAELKNKKIELEEQKKLIEEQKKSTEERKKLTDEKNKMEERKKEAERKDELLEAKKKKQENIKTGTLQQDISTKDIEEIRKQKEEQDRLIRIQQEAEKRKSAREAYGKLANANSSDLIVRAENERVGHLGNIVEREKDAAKFQGTYLSAGTAINKAIEGFGMYMLKFRMFQRGIEDIGKAIKYLQQMEDTSFELGIVSQMGIERIRSMRHELLLTATNYKQSAEEIGKAQLGIVKTGVSLKDSMEIVRASLELSKATYSDLGSASESINKILLPLELTGASAENVSKWLYNISITTPASLSSLDQALRQTSAVFGTFLEDITMTGQGLETYKENLAETQLTLLGLIHTQGKTGSVALYKFL